MKNEGIPELHGLVEKLEFYFLGLTFTLLGLSIQTFKPTNFLSADLVEITGWLLLLISGLVGLSRLEWIPIGLGVKAREEYLDEAHRSLKEAQSSGEPVFDISSHQQINVFELREVAEKSLEEVRNRDKKLDRKHYAKYKAQKSLFLVGLIALLLARAQGVIYRAVLNCVESLI
ncbi:MAG: hypothetical protein NTY53_04975 [Kiritimatiellaeota bacterium]|nr:hypothetical protein [Kiritimatiellota bacterium]